jgi:hypothetical protein
MKRREASGKPSTAGMKKRQAGTPLLRSEHLLSKRPGLSSTHMALEISIFWGNKIRVISMTGVNMTNIPRLADELHGYMQFRATREGKAYDLSPKFFRANLKAGVVSFFGVEVGKSDLLRDFQNPECFAEWKSVPAAGELNPLGFWDCRPNYGRAKAQVCTYRKGQ